MTQYPSLRKLIVLTRERTILSKISYYTISKPINNKISCYILNTSTFKKHLTIIDYFYFPHNPPEKATRNKYLASLF